MANLLAGERRVTHLLHRMETTGRRLGVTVTPTATRQRAGRRRVQASRRARAEATEKAAAAEDTERLVARCGGGELLADRDEQLVSEARAARLRVVRDAREELERQPCLESK